MLGYPALKEERRKKSLFHRTRPDGWTPCQTPNGERRTL
jgi:hypothetical protein